MAAVNVQAQWQVQGSNTAQSDEQDTEPPQNDGSSTNPSARIDSDDQLTQALTEFEAAKCSNGGPTKTAFIDFSTQDPLEKAYIEEVAQNFAVTIQQYSLAPDLTSESARSVRFLFELERKGAVKSITVFAREEDTGLKQFVTELIGNSAPFPVFDSLVHECFETLVISAIFDF
jgi:hypothetical protein